MQLTLWTYEGPPHVGAMRIATAMEGVHYVLHAPQGDTYADLLFTMIERLPKRPPVTYTTFQARDLGGDTAELFKTAAREAYERFKPAAMMVGASCTAELIQDDPGGLCKALDLPVPVIALELPSYQRKENWGASETFYQMVRARAGPNAPVPGTPKAQRVAGARPRCNILGPSALGFRHRDDLREITALLLQMGIDINVVAPLGATPADLARLGEADFNVVLYPEIAALTASWLNRTFGQPATKTIPIGAGATRDFIREVAQLADIDATTVLASADSRATWYAKSVDSTYLTNKRVFVFGDATHAVAAARVASEEMGFKVVGIGTYAREFAREVREAAKLYDVEALISDDYLEIEARISELRPELVLLQKTMMTVEGVARRIDPEHDIWAAAEPVVKRWIARELSPVTRIQRFAGEAETAIRNIARMAQAPVEAPPVARPASGLRWFAMGAAVAGAAFLLAALLF